MSHLLHRVSDLNRKISKLRRDSYSSKLSEYKDLVYVISVEKSLMPIKFKEVLDSLFNLEPEQIDNLSDEKARYYIDTFKNLEEELDKLEL